MLKGIKLRLYPNHNQQDQLWQMFSNDRFVWNQMLGMMKERYKNNKDLPFLSKFGLNYLLCLYKRTLKIYENESAACLPCLSYH